MKLEFFFDCSSPRTYLAFEGIQPIAARHGVAIDWRPILVGGVFNAVKYAMTLRGIDCGECRRPFKPLEGADKARVQAVLEKNLGETLRI